MENVRSTGFDIGATGMKSITLMEDGSVKNYECSPTKEIRGPDDFNGLILDYYKKYGLKGRKIPFGLSTPTSWDSDGRQVIDKVVNIPWLQNAAQNIIGYLEGALKVNGRGAHDALCFSKAEVTEYLEHHHFKKIPVIFFMGIGTGVATMLSVDGKPVLALKELGHLTLYSGGRLCSCGSKGCVDAYVGKAGIAKTLRSVISKSRNIDKTLYKGIDTKEIFKRARESSDPVCQEVVDITNQCLAIFVRTIKMMTDCSIVIISGNVSRDFDMIEVGISSYLLRNFSFPKDTFFNFEIFKGSYPATGAAIGAAMLAAEP